MGCLDGAVGGVGPEDFLEDDLVLVLGHFVGDGVGAPFFFVVNFPRTLLPDMVDLFPNHMRLMAP